MLIYNPFWDWNSGGQCHVNPTLRDSYPQWYAFGKPQQGGLDGGLYYGFAAEDSCFTIKCGCDFAPDSPRFRMKSMYQVKRHATQLNLQNGIMPIDEANDNVLASQPSLGREVAFSALTCVSVHLSMTMHKLVTVPHYTCRFNSE